MAATYGNEQERVHGTTFTTTGSTVTGDVVFESLTDEAVTLSGTGTITGSTPVVDVSNSQIATTGFVKIAVNNLVDSAPGALNTLNELAAALGDDANYAATITTALSGKQASITTSARLNANLIHDGTISNTEFGYVNGVTSAIQTQIDSKQATIGDGDLTIARTTGLQAALDAKQATITDASLTIARTNGLQAALDAKHATIDANNKLNAAFIGGGNVSTTEYDYLNGVTSAIQTQIDGNTTLTNTKATKAFAIAQAVALG